MPVDDRPEKRAVTGSFVKLLRHSQADRGMSLIRESSRCVRAGELHEIVTTDADLLPDATVSRVGFLGFVEVTVAGVIDAGDEVRIGGATVGSVLGFDACHHPNHYNVIVRAERLMTADILDLSVEDTIVFTAGPTDDTSR